MEVIQYNEYVVSTVDTDGLVLNSLRPSDVYMRQ